MFQRLAFGVFTLVAVVTVSFWLWMPMQRIQNTPLCAPIGGQSCSFTLFTVEMGLFVVTSVAGIVVLGVVVQQLFGPIQGGLRDEEPPRR